MKQLDHHREKTEVWIYRGATEVVGTARIPDICVRLRPQHLLTDVMQGRRQGEGRHPAFLSLSEQLEIAVALTETGRLSGGASEAGGSRVCFCTS